MSELVIKSPRARVSLTGNQRAWVVLLAAFVVFCVVCLVSGFGLNYFLFQSTVPMQVALDVGRGTAAYLESSDPDENVAPQTGHFMLWNERIRLDGQSQATMFFRDSYHNNQLIAAVTMKRGTSLYLGSAMRPRFEWSDVEYRIDLTNVTGDIDVYVPNGLDRPIWISFQTPEGAFVYLTESGQYNVMASPSQLQVSNRSGNAVLIAPNRANPRLVGAGERGALSFEGGASDAVLSPAPINLLQNSEVQNMETGSTLLSDMLLPDLVRPWQCGDHNSQPNGYYDIDMPAGRPGIRLVRGNGANTHGETSCSQSPGPGQTGRDVTAYNSLVLKATFYIAGQSLPVCGINGSECPLMLSIDYIFRDAGGVEQPQKWFHGFYTRNDPAQTYPIRCSSCLVEHDSVYAGTWYTYESTNLFDLIPNTERPISLLLVRFYASGHEYDVTVGDVALFAS